MFNTLRKSDEFWTTQISPDLMQQLSRLKALLPDQRPVGAQYTIQSAFGQRLIVQSCARTTDRQP